MTDGQDRSYKPPFPAWAHQAEALQRLEGRKFFALFMAMRTGKTKVVLDDFGRLEMAGEVRDLLVSAPAGAYRTWETAAHDHLSPDLQSRSRRFTWDSTRPQLRELEAFLLDTSAPRMLLVNVEALSVVDPAREACMRFLEGQRGMAVVDESTVLRHLEAKRTKFVCEELAPRAKYRRILSGLPSPNTPLDLYSQLYFLNPGILQCRTYFGFRARYAILKKMKVGPIKANKDGVKSRRSIDMVVNYRNLDHLNQLIAPHMFRRELKDCYDLPPKIYMVRDVDLTPEQERIYKEMKEQATAQLTQEEFVTVDMVMTQILRLHQILCGHVPSDDGINHEIPELRTKALIEVLREYDGKAIIWCSYDLDIRKVKAALEAEFGEGSTSQFWGGNRATREMEERQFLVDPKRRFMVATPASGGRGRTWTVADLMVYYSNTPDLEHRAQSEERPQAVGRPTSVACVDLMAPRGTVDWKILDSLKRKIKLSALVLGEEPSNWLE